MNKPLVSIIVPVYNVESYLRECLDSLVQQTLRNIEIICVDDCGRDGSMRVVEEYAAADDRVLILRHEANRGLAAARNTGMAVAHAPYIMFCDSDDYYELNMCEKMYTALDNAPEADIAMCGARLLHDVKRSKKIMVEDDNHHTVKFQGFRRFSPHVLRLSSKTVWTRIFRRDFLVSTGVKFPEGLRYEDAYFIYACAAHARGIFFLPDKLYNYRIRKGSIMRQTDAKESFLGIDHIHVATKLWEYYRQHGILHKWDFYMAEVMANYLRLALKYEDNEDARIRITQIFRQFIRQEGWNESNMPLHIAVALYFSIERGDVVKRKRFGGLFRCTESFNVRKMYICGIRVMKEEYRIDRIQRSILGYKRKITLPSKEVYSCLVDDAPLLADLKALGSFTFIPHSGRMGEMVSAASALCYLETNRIPYTLLGKTAKVGDTIVYGGGEWTERRMYDKHIHEALGLMRQAKHIVILPSSFLDCDSLLQIIDERFVIYCREKISYQYMKERSNGALVKLAHDMLLYAGNDVLHAALPSVAPPRRCHDILHDMAFLPQERRGIFLRSDYIGMGISDDYCMDLNDFGRCDNSCSREDLIVSAQFILHLMRCQKRVVTDNLTVALAAALMGVKTHMVDDARGCAASAYAHTLSLFPHVEWMEDLPQSDVDAQGKDTNAFFLPFMQHYVRMKRGRIENCLQLLYRNDGIMEHKTLYNQEDS